MKGRKCRILAAAKMNSILIEFEDGQRECVSRRAVRRIKGGKNNVSMDNQKAY